MKKQKNKVESFLKAEIDPAYRERALFIFNQALRKKPSSILDIGCGRGFYTNRLSNFLFVRKIIGLELNEQYLKEAKRNCLSKKVEYLNQDFYLWKTKKKFDLIIMSEILEHLSDDKLALQKAVNLLNKNGKIIITVPHHDFPFFWDPLNYILMKFGLHLPSHIWWLAGIWADHNRLYSKQQLQNLVASQKLMTIEEHNQIHWCWPFTHFLLYGIGKNLVTRLNFKSFNRFEQSDGFVSMILASLFRLPEAIYQRAKTYFNISSNRSAGLVGVYQKKAN